MFINLKSIISLLLAVATVYTFVKAMRLEFLFEPIKELWRQLDKYARTLVTCAVAFLAIKVVSKDGTNTLDNAGGSVTNNVGIVTNTIGQLDSDIGDSNVVSHIMSILRSTPVPPARTIPAWYTALGYSTTDTDGDGIPDVWEKWTRTNPNVDDSNLDPDGDGVCNYDEFLNQCDPMCGDTDGDGYSDFIEINGMASGKSWFNPLVRASYDYVESDDNSNGVPDRWEDSGYPYGYVDVNGDGLTDNVTFPQVSYDNFDVLVKITTTRPALLTWGVGTGYVVQPCTNLEMRLRLTVDDITDLKLLGALPDDEADGLWYSKMEISWPNGRVQETERNRVRLADGTTVDCENMNGEFRGEINATQSSLTSRFVHKWLYFNGWSCGCWEHGGLNAIGYLDYTNVVPPFTWYVNGNEACTTNSDFITAGLVYDYWDGFLPITVTCRASETNEYTRLPIESSDTVDIGHCPPSVTNIVGAAWEPNSHTNATDHLPRPKEEHRYRFTDYCPWTYEVTYCVGWDHAKVHTRNLSRILVEDNIDHCIGIIGEEDDEIDLSDYLNNDSKEILGLLKFTVNGTNANGHLLVVDEEPSDLNPSIYEVNVLSMDDVVLDRMWLVISSQDARETYDVWKVNENNIEWTNILPKPFATLAIATNFMGSVVPDTANVIRWNKPDRLNRHSYMHHDAVYEMRSIPVEGGHGHQATYNAQGTLIVNTIAAGTADRFAPESIWNKSIQKHRLHDVLPYIRCLQLDGNPILTDNKTGLLTDAIPTRFTRPCIFQGQETDAYLVRRPIIPTGVVNE